MARTLLPENASFPEHVVAFGSVEVQAYIRQPPKSGRFGWGARSPWILKLTNQILFDGYLKVRNEAGEAIRLAFPGAAQYVAVYI